MILTKRETIRLQIKALQILDGAMARKGAVSCCFGRPLLNLSFRADKSPPSLVQLLQPGLQPSLVMPVREIR